MKHELKRKRDNFEIFCMKIHSDTKKQQIMYRTKKTDVSFD